MPFCTRCGNQVHDQAAFCAHCGAGQPHTRTQTDFLESISDRTASMLCYVPVFGIIAAIVFLASQKFRTHHQVRFDAFQSIYLFVAWLIISSAAPGLFLVGGDHFGFAHALRKLIEAAIFILWVYLLVKAAQQQPVKLPVIGDLAERSAAEQK